MSSDPASQPADEKVEKPKRKRTKPLVLAGLIVAIAVSLSVLARGERGAISMVLQQIVTNSPNVVNYTFKLHNDAWDCRMQPQLFTKQPDGHFLIAPLKFTLANSSTLQNVKKGASVELTVEKSSPESSFLTVTCTKVGASPSYRHLAILNERLKHKFGLVPLIFRDRTTIAVDLNTSLSLQGRR